MCGMWATQYSSYMYRVLLLLIPITHMSLLQTYWFPAVLALNVYIYVMKGQLMQRCNNDYIYNTAWLKSEQTRTINCYQHASYSDNYVGIRLCVCETYSHLLCSIHAVLN